MGLEVKTNKEPGTEVRVTPASRPAIVGLMIVLLTLIELLLVFLVFDAVARGANSPVVTDEATAQAFLAGWFQSDQRIISLWLGGIFLNIAFITLLYQRYFMDHVTIVKRRFRKWEDEGVQLR